MLLPASPGAWEAEAEGGKLEATQPPQDAGLGCYSVVGYWLRSPGETDNTMIEGKGGSVRACVLNSVLASSVLSKVAKLPQVVQQQAPVASIQQVASASQQVGLETQVSQGSHAGYPTLHLRCLLTTAAGGGRAGCSCVAWSVLGSGRGSTAP